MTEENKVTDEELQEELNEEENTSEEQTEEKQDELSEQEEQKEESKSEEKTDEDLEAKFLRLSADFQNYRKRVDKEKSDIYAYANEKIILDMLDVIDNFDRAMLTAPADDKFAEGMSLILKQLQDILTKNNVAEIDALGKDFDPAFHNAVMTEDGEESNKVTKVLQKGYTFNGKVIRPVMVAVSK